MGFLIRMIVFLLWSGMACLMIGLLTSPQFAVAVFLLFAVFTRNTVIHGGIVEDRDKEDRED